MILLKWGYLTIILSSILKSHEKLRLHFFLFMDAVAHPSYFGKHCTPGVNIKNIQVGPSCSLQVYVNLCDFH